jgi:hypothetical protein
MKVKEITREFRRYPGISENENTTYQSLLYTMKALRRGKSIVVNTFIKK